MFNLGGAFYAARIAKAGIYLAMHGALWAPDEVTKDTEHNLFVRKF